MVLFHVQAYRATGNRQFLTAARKGAGQLISKTTDKRAGLYEGIAGGGFAMEQVYKLLTMRNTGPVSRWLWKPFCDRRFGMRKVFIGTTPMTSFMAVRAPAFSCYTPLLHVPTCVSSIHFRAPRAVFR